ncbi:Uu.00g033980.m01.CDS01 [Anthostomella pinea]|uniref:Uu.00g033980.m01.CDS01 n=1 Tax=Anthostomella pinea TaxID=933095 RepID=A0AAI8V9Z0_9PEZI|nr:Uu.00g033980.m01.CDS01 [Anthostomella pinea]
MNAITHEVENLVSSKHLKLGAVFAMQIFLDAHRILKRRSQMALAQRTAKTTESLRMLKTPEKRILRHNNARSNWGAAQARILQWAMNGIKDILDDPLIKLKMKAIRAKKPIGLMVEIRNESVMPRNYVEECGMTKTSRCTPNT